MKKIIFIFVLSAAFNADAQRFLAGITAGFVATDVYGSDIVPDADSWNDVDFSKAGFVFGGIVNTSLSSKLTLNLEFNYIQKGTQQPADINGSGYYKFAFNYFEFPLMLKYRFHFNMKQKAVKGFSLHAGAAVGKLVSSLAEGDNFYSKDDYTYLNETDVNLLAGIGYNFSEHFNFTFRYSNSLIPVFKQETATPALGASTFNNGNSLVLHFILQYMFGSEKTSPDAAD